MPIFRSNMCRRLTVVPVRQPHGDGATHCAATKCLCSLRSILLFANMDVPRHILALDIYPYLSKVIRVGGSTRVDPQYIYANTICFMIQPEIYCQPFFH
jgi:hypothetical protein